MAQSACDVSTLVREQIMQAWRLREDTALKESLGQLFTPWLQCVKPDPQYGIVAYTAVAVAGRSCCGWHLMVDVWLLLCVAVSSVAQRLRGWQAARGVACAGAGSARRRHCAPTDGGTMQGRVCRGDEKGCTETQGWDIGHQEETVGTLTAALMMMMMVVHTAMIYRVPTPPRKSWIFFLIPGPGKSWKITFDPGKAWENCCHQMSYFKAKMHLIGFRLGLCPRPTLGELTALPQIGSPSWV